MLRYPLDKVDHNLFRIRTFDAEQESVWNALKLPVPPFRPDVDEIREAQATKTAEHQRQIEEEQRVSHMLSRFDPNSSDIDALTAANEYLTPFAYRTKMLYARARPDQLGITPTIETPLHPSYPSGHAMQAYAFRDVMSCRHPEHKQQYAHAAEEIAQNRVRAGVHYPSDSVVSAELMRQLRCPMMRRLARKKLVPELCAC